MRITSPVIGALAAVALAGAACDHKPTAPSSASDTRTYAFNFSAGLQGWAGGIAHYYTGSSSPTSLVVEHRNLPAPLDTLGGGVFVSGDAKGIDYVGPLLYLKRQVTDLSPSTFYNAEFTAQFATDAPYGCSSNNTANCPYPPGGDGVWVKGGAANMEPLPVLANGDWVRLTLDVGEKSSEAGAASRVLGNISNSVRCGPTSQETESRWELKTLHSESGLRVQTASDGSLWLLVGADSGWPQGTSVYFTQVTVTLQPVQ